MGAFRNSEQEAKVHCDFIGQIARAAPFTPNLTIDCQPMDRKDLQRLKDSGLSSGNFNVEVWDAEMFAEMCPEKAKYRGFERSLEFFLEAVDILGAGCVGTNFVAGVSLIPPNGHRTWQESRDLMAEGFRWLIKHGVFPSFISLRLGVRSIYGDDLSNRAKVPPTEHYLEVGLAHHAAMEEYGLYGPLNKLLYCPLDCLPHLYAGEIGMLELAGSVANWAAQAVPEDANWIAKFTASLKSPVAKS